jgi:cell wall assembly regulator SMI1
MNFSIRFQQTDKLAIEKTEKELQFQFPNDYKAFLLELNGGRRPLKNILRYEGVDGIISETAIDSFFGVDCVENYSLKNMYTFYTSASRIPPSALPIASDIAGNLLCMDFKGNHSGRIYFWDHELECDLNGYDNLSLVANSFSTLLTQIKVDES